MAARDDAGSFLTSLPGTIGAALRAVDWALSPLGPPDAWPSSLKTTIGLMLGARAQIVLFWGPDHAALYNEAYAPTIGDKHPGALGAPARVYWAELWDDLEPLLRGVRETGETFEAKDRPFYIERHGYGETVYFDVSYSAVPAEDGGVGGVLCIVAETTEQVLASRRQAYRLTLEERLRDAGSAQDVLRQACEALGTALGGRIVSVSELRPGGKEVDVVGEWRVPGVPSILGRRRMADWGVDRIPDLLSNRPELVSDITTDPRTRSFAEAAYAAVGCRASLTVPFVRKGKVRALLAVGAAEPRRWSAHEVALARETVERTWQAAARVRAEAALRASEERLRLATAAADIGTWDFDPVSGALTWDARCRALFGLPAGAPVDYDIFLAGLHPDDRDAAHAAVQRALEPDGPGGYMVEYRTVGLADGVERWISARGRAVFHGTGAARRAVRFLGTVIDITTLKRAEEELERRVGEALAERKLWADIVEGTDVFVQVVAPDFSWLAINSAAAREFAHIFGTPLPRAGDSMLTLLHDQPAHREAVRAVWARALAGEEFTEVGEFGDPARDRRTYEMKYNVLRDAAGRQIGAYQFVYDVTERVRAAERLAAAEEQLRQSQKLETIGQLTGGVAHDFNNLLTPIVGALDLLRRRLDDERAQRLTSGALQAADRARTLVQRLLAFSRRQHLRPRSVDVAVLVDGMTDLIARSLGPRIVIAAQADPATPPALVDPNQLELALLNLAVNARDAMPGGGTLRIAVGAEESGPEGGALPPGRYVRVAVVDTGVGMDAETLKRATEPFFTTKGVGRGTGLGLSAVQGLAAQSGGAFTLTSAPGHGTTATLWLPVSAEPAERPAADDAPLPVAASADRTVLLVDDEALVRAGTAEMLIEAGYRVLQAASGFAAVQLVRDGATPDVLVTDYAMPGMTGTELARALRQLRPDLPVLLITGFATLNDRDAVGLPRLAKPFRQADLAAAVAELVGSGRVQLLPRRQVETG